MKSGTGSVVGRANVASSSKPPQPSRPSDRRWLYLAIGIGVAAIGLALWNQHATHAAHVRVHRHHPHRQAKAAPPVPVVGVPENSPALVASAAPAASNDGSYVQVSVRSPEAEQAELDRRSAFFQQAFDQEARDRVWSPTMEQTVREAYPATAGVDAVLVSSECHATLCRLEFKYSSPDVRNDHLSSLSRQFQDLPTAVYTYPDEVHGKDCVIVYLARQGNELPTYRPANEPNTPPH
jgi:hypothetical protein